MKELVAKLVAVSKEIGFLEFDKTNDSYDRRGSGRPNYVSAGSVIRKLNIEFAKQGLLAYVEDQKVSVSQTTNAKGSQVTLVTITGYVCFTDGDHTLRVCATGSGADHGDKAAMKAATAMMKYAFAHTLTLGWDVADPEADSANDEPRGAKATGTGKPKGRPAKASAKEEEPANGAADPIADLKALIPQAADGKSLDKLRGTLLGLKRNGMSEPVFEGIKTMIVNRRGELNGAA